MPLRVLAEISEGSVVMVRRYPSICWEIRISSNSSTFSPPCHFFMDVLPEKESAYVTTLLNSVPAVFEQRCSINDMDFILSCLKQTICHRGVSKNTQNLLLHTLIPLSSFKVGLMGSQELKENVVHIIASLDLQLELTGANKVRTTFPILNQF